MTPWTAAVDARRVPPGEDLGQATAAQIRAVTGQLGIREAAYIRRFDLERTFRFCKQALGWMTPRVHDAAQHRSVSTRQPGRRWAG